MQPAARRPPAVVVVNSKVIQALEYAHASRHALILEIPSGRYGPRHAFRGGYRAAALAEHVTALLVPLLPQCARAHLPPFWLLGDVEGLPWYPLCSLLHLKKIFRRSGCRLSTGSVGGILH
jgi:hypothetical protein